MDSTKGDNNERVEPFRTEEFDVEPIRYTDSEDRRNQVGKGVGWKTFYQQGEHDQRKSFQCVPMGFGNPWGQERHTHNKYIMEGNWSQSDNYAGFLRFKTTMV